MAERHTTLGSTDSPGAAALSLQPETPAWAAERPVRMAIGEADDAITLGATIG
jgi:hypothetical protein